METKEIKITPPEGFEVDEEHSTFKCIKFKPIKVKPWRDDDNARFDGYYTSDFSRILKMSGVPNIPVYYDLYATEKQARSALAMARISQIIANDKRFGGAITDKEWDDETYKYVINRSGKYICKECFTHYHHFLAFHTEQQRDLFLEENEDLVKDYLMI